MSPSCWEPQEQTLAWGVGRASPVTGSGMGEDAVSPLGSTGFLLVPSRGSQRGEAGSRSQNIGSLPSSGELPAPKGRPAEGADAHCPRPGLRRVCLCNTRALCVHACVCPGRRTWWELARARLFSGGPAGSGNAFQGRHLARDLKARDLKDRCVCPAGDGGGAALLRAGGCEHRPGALEPRCLQGLQVAWGDRLLAKRGVMRLRV